MLQAAQGDIGRGIMDNVDDDYALSSGNLSLFWSVAADGIYNQAGEKVGNIPTTNGSNMENFAVYWDGDLGRELLDGNKLVKYSVTSGTERIYYNSKNSALPGSINNGTKSNACLTADLSKYAGKKLVSATLNLYDKFSNTEKKNSVLHLDYCSKNDWDEATVTTNDITVRGENTPLSSLGLQVSPAYNVDYKEISFDVTDVIKEKCTDNLITFTLWTGTGREQVIASKEYSGTDAQGPTLVLEFEGEEPTPTPTVVPTTTPTLKPTATPTVVPTATPTLKPTATPTVVPAVNPTLKPTATPTVVPTATPTLKPTAIPTVVPTATPTLKPTPTPTVVSTATPTLKPTATPAVTSTLKPTTIPTAIPTVIPTTTPNLANNKITAMINSNNKLDVTLDFENVDMNDVNVYVAFKNNGKLVGMKMPQASELKGIDLIDKEYTDIEVYAWDNKQKPYANIVRIVNNVQ